MLLKIYKVYPGKLPLSKGSSVVLLGCLFWKQAVKIKGFVYVRCCYLKAKHGNYLLAEPDQVCLIQNSVSGEMAVLGADVCAFI